MKVAFQGVSGAYSERATRQFFGKEADPVACHDFNAVFRAVKTGKVPFGVLPLENSLTGSIHQNYDLLLKEPVVIVGEVKERISHSLLARKGTRLADVRVVYSHPQALSQCAGFFAKHKRAEATPFFDTAGSARYVATLERKDVAAIASPEAGRRYGLTALRHGIEDNAENFTRFLVIARPSKKTPTRLKKPMKTSIVFALKSIPGALHKSLSVFALRDIDLVKIESRPIPGSPWQYLFYLDFVTPQDPKLSARVLDHLSEVTVFTKVLGTYPPA